MDSNKGLTKTQINKIATRHFGLPNLKTRNSDRLDHSNQTVWNLEAALQAAFKLGQASK